MSWLYEPEPGRHDIDESDIRIRPNPKGNKPRTKNRPSYKTAPLGFVVGVDLARYRVLLDGDQREITATLAKELRRDGVAVGDRVALAGDITETEGALARIVRIEPVGQHALPITVSALLFIGQRICREITQQDVERFGRQPRAALAADRALCAGPEYRPLCVDPGDSRRCRRAAVARPGSGAADPVQ